MYDTPGVFYYLMRNAPEINNASGSVVLLKHPETPCGIFRERLYANQEDASPKAYSTQKSNFPSFCMVMRQLDCRLVTNIPNQD